MSLITERSESLAVESEAAAHHASGKEILAYVHELLHRNGILFEKVIFLRPLKVRAYESNNDSLPQHCKIHQSGNGKCYIIISENLLSGSKESFKGFLGALPDWRSSITFYLLVEVARYKWAAWSSNRCEQWALNELCSAKPFNRLES